jgi:hypothetical protein
MARLTNAIPSDGNLRRWGRVISIGERYIRNIAQSKQFTSDFIRSGAALARGRAYSQNTYMGLNNG